MKPIVGYVGVAVVAASVSAFLSRRDTSPSAPYAPRTAETQSALPEKPSAERARAHAVTSRAGAPLDPDEDVAPPSKAVPVADEDDAGDTIRYTVYAVIYVVWAASLAYSIREHRRNREEEQNIIAEAEARRRRDEREPEPA